MQKNLIKISTDQDSSDQEINCSCEILNDTSLSNVSDGSCDCSECLQANLNAFNEFKQSEEIAIQKLRQSESMDNKKTKIFKKRQQSHEGLKKFAQCDPTWKNNFFKNQSQKPAQVSVQEQNKIKPKTKNCFSAQNINDFFIITRQRTRKYLNQRNKINRQNQNQKDHLKKKIKENLQILKFTVKALQKKQLNKSKKLEGSSIHAHDWNWGFPAQFSEIRKKKIECKQKLQKRKQKRSKVDTNLQKIIPQFFKCSDKFLQQAKKERLEKLKQCKGCPYDKCPNHHMRTSEQKLKQIKKFFQAQLKQRNEIKRKQKQKQQENLKVRKAKLRAIDIKCKKILKKSKRYDPNQSKSDFRLSIDHFSTFSDLRINKNKIETSQQQNKQIKRKQKQNKNLLQEAIYEDVFQKQQSQNKVQRSTNNDPQFELQNLMNKSYFSKIVKQAKIRSPKKIKLEDQKYRKQKQLKIKNLLNTQSQKQKKKQLALQIQIKKNALMQEFRRQKQLKQPKNQKLKNQLKDSLIQSKKLV